MPKIGSINPGSIKMNNEHSAKPTITDVTRTLNELMRDDHAWVSDEWNQAWDKLKKDLYDRKLIQS